MLPCILPMAVLSGSNSIPDCSSFRHPMQYFRKVIHGLLFVVVFLGTVLWLLCICRVLLYLEKVTSMPKDVQKPKVRCFSQCPPCVLMYNRKVKTITGKKYMSSMFLLQFSALPQELTLLMYFVFRKQFYSTNSLVSLSLYSHSFLNSVSSHFSHFQFPILDFLKDSVLVTN